MHASKLPKPLLEMLPSDYIAHCLADLQQAGLMPTDPEQRMSLARLCELQYWRMRTSDSSTAHANGVSLARASETEWYKRLHVVDVTTKAQEERNILDLRYGIVSLEPKRKFKRKLLYMPSAVMQERKHTLRQERRARSWK